ncbi:MAG TPA: hypothetical protein VIK86_06400 [Candidatus Paceibacterota bacterium]
MSNILIENYREFDIEFSTNSEKFQCICTEEDTKESISFSAVKKFIDEYKKTNQNFNPFWVEPLPRSYKNDKIKIIGVRKDGRFIYEDLKGNKNQLSDYDLKDYMLIKSENQNNLILLNELSIKIKKQSDENIETREKLISTLKIVTLKEFKETLK